MFKLKAILIVLLFSQSYCFGQKSNTYYFHLDKITIKDKIVLDSSKSAKRYFEKAYTQFSLNGYTGVSLKDSAKKSSGTHYYFSYTNKFSKITLLNQDKKRNNSTNTKDYLKASRGLNAELEELENNGFPFAQINIIEQTESNNRLHLTYKIDSGAFYRINKIHIKSQNKFHEKTILNIIGLNAGDMYNERKINNIPALLSASKLYKTLRPTQILFKNSGADIYIYIGKEKSSNADGYIGFQQDQLTNKLVLNGYLNLQLTNSFNRAEIIDMQWKSNPDKTQKFHAFIEYPYILNTPLGMGSKIELRKQDSTFIRTDITFNLNYSHPIAKFSLFDQIESSSTLRNTAPSEFRNYSKNTIGASVQIKPPKINALQFYHPEILFLGGFYNYRNDTIADNKQKTSNAKYHLGYKHTIDFLKFFHLNNSIQFKGLNSTISLSRNELIYFGGLNSVRGFYELELSGNDIWSYLNEIEFRPVEAISIFALFDYSTFKYQGQHETKSIGFGFGLNNNNSTLEIIVANGVLDNNPFNLANTKIHLGFKSSF